MGLGLIGWIAIGWPEVSATARAFMAIFAAFGAAAIAGGVAGLLRADRLVLDPAGLTHQGFRRARRWPWSQLAGLRVLNDEGVCTIELMRRGRARANPRRLADPARAPLRPAGRRARPLELR